jgi:hypothetical protein
MHRFVNRIAAVGLILLSLAFAACQMPATNSNVAVANTNANSSNSLANSINSNANSAVSSIETSEPAIYQANVNLTLEAIGETQKATLPAIGAKVARTGADRMMEFTLPTNEKVIYLDKGGVNYLILPNRKQFAELTKDSVGFEVRRLLMPEQIVEQVKRLQGIREVGEETFAGRSAVKYAYAATANTQTQAGKVDTESYLIIDKETGLPLRSETVTQSQSGSNVQGYKGIRLVTEMSDITTTPDAAAFNVPADFKKIDPEQVRAQANLIFSGVAALIGQAMKQAQPAASASPAM